MEAERLNDKERARRDGPKPESAATAATTGSTKLAADPIVKTLSPGDAGGGGAAEGGAGAAGATSAGDIAPKWAVDGSEED